MRSKFVCSIVLAGFLVGTFALVRAQTDTVPAGAAVMTPPGPVSVQTGGDVLGFQYVSAEPAISSDVAHVVKGAPFSLEASIEMAQTLSDGNRIVHRQIVHLYRDSKGRTRREETLAAIGPWAASGTPPTMITIQDPVSGVSYFLDPKRKIAGKLPAGPGGKNVMFRRDGGDGPATASVSSAPVAGGFVAGGEGQMLVLGLDGPRGQILRPEEKSESLGKESVAGILADGTRTTTTIPTDAIGNERPLDIVRERWYSPDLQIVLRSKQTDPRFGETTYEVTRLDRVEPSPSFFEVPADYKVKGGENHVFTKHDSDSR